MFLQLWDGFEQILLRQIGQPEKIITTWEDIYARDDWQAFLEERGYTLAAPAVFEKRPPR